VKLVKLVKLPSSYHLLLSERLNRANGADIWVAACSQTFGQMSSRWPSSARSGTTKKLRGTAASEALTKPATDDGVEWEEPAAALIVKESAGYPCFLQQFGQDTRNAATGPKITYDDARLGAANGRAALDSGFFRARWDRATRAEQNYLRAMAEDEECRSALLSRRRGIRHDQTPGTGNNLG
jgi:hypothetical protein